MSLAEVLQPAIRVATDGFVIDQTFFDQTQANVDFFDDLPATAALFLDPDGTPRDVGTVFRNPDLANTYRRIAHLGPKGFYRGAVADGDHRDGAEPARGARRQPPLAARGDDDAGPEELRGARAAADPRRVPRRRRVRDGPAVERRLDGR